MTIFNKKNVTQTKLPAEQQTRRAFLQYVSTGLILPSVISMIPNPIGGKVYAQSEKMIDPKWLKLTEKYGSHTGTFGKIGEPVTLVVGYQPYWAAAWAASVNKQAKIWTKYLPAGSDVVWSPNLSGPLVNEKLYFGENQLGYMAETPALAAGDFISCDMVAATSYDVGETSSICIRNDLLNQVKSPEDLGKQRVGVAFGSYSHRHILTWMQQNQIEIKLLNHQSNKLQIEALKAKRLGASILWEPFAQMLEQQEIASRWTTGQDIPCSCSHHFPEAVAHTFRGVCAVVAIHDWLRERPDIVVAYLKAEEECRDMLSHAPDLATYYISRDVPEVPPAIIRASLDMIVWDSRITCEMKQHLKGCARMWKEQSILSKKRSSDPDVYVDEWADDSYLRLAIEEMVHEGWWTSNKLPGFPREASPEQLKRHHWKVYEKTEFKADVWNQTKV